MYTPTITIAIGATSPVANGSITVIDIDTGSNTVMLSITTPWGDSATDSWLTVGQISSTVKNLNAPIREWIYIVKLLYVTSSSATFQGLSFAYDDSKLKSPGGTNQLTVSSNLPVRQVPNATINYDYTITNNSSNSIPLRWIFATTVTGSVSIKTTEALPPITYEDRNCWYDDWTSGNPACQERTIGAGASYHITGSATLPATGQKDFTLGAFVEISNYWPGKTEWVAPIGWQTGYTKTVIVDPCVGKICTPDYICQGCDSYQAVCNSVDPNGPCIQGPLIQLNDSRCAINGYIYISSTPSGATIYVDNIAMGITGTAPVIVEASVLANPHIVRLVLANYEVWVDNNVNVSCTAPVVINPSLTAWAPKIAQIIVELDPLTPGSYVSNPNVINKFTDILNNQVLMRFANISLNSVTYDPQNHQIIIEIEELQTLSAYQYSLLSYPNIKTLAIWVPIIIAIAIILAALPLIQILLGWIWKHIYSWIKGVAQTTSSVKITTCIAISESTCVLPTEPVIVEFAGQKLTAESSNNFMVSFNDIKVQGAETTYPIKAYIPVSTDSKVYKAYYEGTINPTIPTTDITLHLKPEQSTERDYTPPCPLKYPDGSSVPTGVIIKVFQPIIGTTGTASIREYGNRPVKSDGCIDPVKVKSYLTNDMLQWQAIPQDISPTSPDPTPQNGNSGIIKRVMDTKNKITILTYSKDNNDLTVDKIDIKNLDTNSIVKTKSGKDIGSSQTEIEGLPMGRYQAIITKSGYDVASCTYGCAIEFTADYLQAVTFTAILESIVPICGTLEVYVLDKYGNEIKTIPYVSMDDKPEQPVSGKKLEIKEVVIQSHKFSVRADKYTSVTENRDVLCSDTVATQIFKLDPTGDVVPASMELTIKDQKGSVSVDKDKAFTVKVTGADPGDDVGIYNIDTTPDTLMAHGLADTTGLYQTDITINEDTTFQIQALQGCLLGICGKDSNIIELKVGIGSPECAIPNPLGGCLVYKSTLTNLGIGLLAALFGVAIIGAVLLRSPAGGEKVVYIPPPPGSPPETPPTVIKEKPPTVAGKLIEQVGSKK